MDRGGGFAGRGRSGDVTGAGGGPGGSAGLDEHGGEDDQGGICAIGRGECGAEDACQWTGDTVSAGEVECGEPGAGEGGGGREVRRGLRN